MLGVLSSGSTATRRGALTTKNLRAAGSVLPDYDGPMSDPIEKRLFEFTARLTDEATAKQLMLDVAKDLKMQAKLKKDSSNRGKRGDSIAWWRWQSDSRRTNAITSTLWMGSASKRWHW